MPASTTVSRLLRRERHAGPECVFGTTSAYGNHELPSNSEYLFEAARPHIGLQINIASRITRRVPVCIWASPHLVSFLLARGSLVAMESCDIEGNLVSRYWTEGGRWFDCG
jgi:hypothetical protein